MSATSRAGRAMQARYVVGGATVLFGTSGVSRSRRSTRIASPFQCRRTSLSERANAPALLSPLGKSPYQVRRIVGSGVEGSAAGPHSATGKLTPTLRLGVNYSRRFVSGFKRASCRQVQGRPRVRRLQPQEGLCRVPVYPSQCVGGSVSRSPSAIPLRWSHAKRPCPRRRSTAGLCPSLLERRHRLRARWHHPLQKLTARLALSPRWPYPPPGRPSRRPAPVGRALSAIG